MIRRLRPFLASTGFILLAPAAFADLTANDVWADWQAYITGFGYSVEGQETQTSDGLTVNGVTINMVQNGAAGSASIAIDRIVLTEQSDGSVSIDLPRIMPFVMSGPSETGGVTRVSMDYRHTGLTIIASGAPERMKYDYSAEDIILESTGFEVDGDILPPENNNLRVAVEDLTGRTDVALDSQRRYNQALQATALRLDLKAIDPVTGVRTDLSGQTQAVTFKGESVLPLRMVEAGDWDAMLDAGFTADGTFTFAANALRFGLDAQNGLTEASVVAGSGTVGARLGQDGLTYTVVQNDLQTEMMLPQLPLPLGFTMDQSKFDLTLPLRETDAAADFGLGLLLSGVAFPDALWGMFDPSGLLARDPANVALDLTGKARLLFNLLDPTEAAAIAPGEAPVKIEELDINQLQVAALGTDLSGAGRFTFDNSDPVAPQPQGAVDLILTGGNGLINTLVAMGILQEQQAMGARMMMGLLAVPGEGPDTLTSRIEITTEGHVLANGQRIQ